MDEIKILCIFFAIISSISSTVPSSQSFTNYHQEIIYPSSKNFLDQTISLGYYPAQISPGFKPRFKDVPQFVPQLVYFESPKRTARGPPQYSLFTPNTIDQRPESVGQIQEYKKALAEEAEEKKQENEIPSTFTDYPDIGGYEKATKSYVDVKGETFKYKYRF